MSQSDIAFKALWIEEDSSGEKPHYPVSVCRRQVSELPEGDLLIRVRHSSVNYKDALSARGNKGVTRKYPHTPGIDAAGEVVESAVDSFSAGDEVIVIGYDLGMNTLGGFGEYIRVPAAWAVQRPQGITLRESMITGTAGFTAALCVRKLLRNGLKPGQGPVLVTGASGGVGSYAVALLSKLGFEVTAMTGSASAHDFLRKLGARQIIDRSELAEPSKKPMLAEQWAGAVDAVGGEPLGNILKSLQYGGSVACCGLVASPVFPATVLPFILRNVNLLGVDSVELPLAEKAEVWEHLAADWKLDNLEDLATDIGLEELVDALDAVFNGRSTGRLVLTLD